MSGQEDPYEKWAASYDLESAKCQWHGPAILFGLMYLHIRRGESLLDLGIGTGLGVLPFHKAGLEIHGVDMSGSMLDECRKRGLPFELTQHDLQQYPWPFPDRRFNHAIAAGLTHFIPDLHRLASEVSRVIKPEGLFGFDYYPYDPIDADGAVMLSDGVYEFYDAEYDHRYYRHSDDYIRSLLADNGFGVLSETEFLAAKESKRYFRTVLSRHSKTAP